MGTDLNVIVEVDGQEVSPPVGWGERWVNGERWRNEWYWLEEQGVPGYQESPAAVRCGHRVIPTGRGEFGHRCASAADMAKADPPKNMKRLLQAAGRHAVLYWWFDS